MRLLSCGFEWRDVANFAYAANSGSWSHACDTTSALGNHSAAGYRAYTATSGATTGSAKAAFVLGVVPYFFNANDSATPTNFLYGGANEFFLRFYFNVNASPAGTYIHEIVRIGDWNGSTGVGTKLWAATVQTGGELRINVQDLTAFAPQFTPTVGTTYRCEVEFIRTSSTTGGSSWTVNTKVYAQTGTTVLAQLSQSYPVYLSTVPYCIDWGVMPVAFQRGAFGIYLDDFAINNNAIASGGSGIHVSSPTGGTAYREQGMDVGATGTYKEWTDASGAGDVAAVEGDNSGANAYTAYSDAANSWIKSTNALPMRHSFVLPNYPTGAGWNSIKSVLVLCRHGDDTGSGGSDVFHKVGVYDGTQIHGSVIDANSSTAIRPTYVIIDEIYGGGTITTSGGGAADFTNWQVLVQRTQDLSGLNLVRASYILLEIEDNDGVTFTPVTLTPRAGIGSVV